MFVDALRRKRCESLLQKGYALIRDGELDAALEVAAQLEKQRHTGGFEIAALAHAGKGELEAAVTVLRRGVETAPDVWINWQLLGNYLSDLERYDNAEAAYQRALACPGCSHDSVTLNLAVLANRRNRPEAALALLDALRDPALVEPAREIRVSTLRALGRLDEALSLAEASLESGPPEGEDGAARWERVAATAARMRLELNQDPADVRRWVVGRLSAAPGAQRSSASSASSPRSARPQRAASRFSSTVPSRSGAPSAAKSPGSSRRTTSRLRPPRTRSRGSASTRNSSIPKTPPTCRSTAPRTWGPPLTSHSG